MSLPDDKIVDILLKNNLITKESLDKLLASAKASKSDLLTVLLKGEYIKEDQLGAAIASHYGVSYIDISKLNISQNDSQIIPEKAARRSKAIAFSSDGNNIKVAMNDPSNRALLQALAQKTGKSVTPYFDFEKEIEGTIDIYKKSLQKVIDELLLEYTRGVSIDAEAPISKVVDELISSAYGDKASDIHIEPQEKDSLIRFRIDGVLQDMVRIPIVLHERIISRIKVLSNLRTDEHLAAQDGKMQATLPEEILDIRVSIIPIALGEKAVLRLLSSHSRSYTLDNLGMNKGDLIKVVKAYNKSYGMILSTGPTGSGKTTSIYGILEVLNTREKNIMTIEDPIEYRIQGANQVQVNVKTNLTFANGLRSILRQDPNIIFVGEIRDNETAGIAVNAALTGHLVLSTLHTNNAATAIPRLTDMKVEPFLVASTVNVIIAQRLIRQICNSCKMSIEISFEELTTSFRKEDVEKFLGNTPKVKIFKGGGCKICRGTGYKDRIGIFEVLEVSKEVKKLIVSKADADIIEAAAVKEGMKTMMQDGLEKVSKGLTTIEEVLRATKVEVT